MNNYVFFVSNAKNLLFREASQMLILKESNYFSLEKQLKYGVDYFQGILSLLLKENKIPVIVAAAETINFATPPKVIIIKEQILLHLCNLLGETYNLRRESIEILHEKGLKSLLENKLCKDRAERLLKEHYYAKGYSDDDIKCSLGNGMIRSGCLCEFFCFDQPIHEILLDKIAILSQQSGLEYQVLIRGRNTADRLEISFYGARSIINRIGEIRSTSCIDKSDKHWHGWIARSRKKMLIENLISLSERYCAHQAV